MIPRFRPFRRAAVPPGRVRGVVLLDGSGTQAETHVGDT